MRTRPCRSWRRGSSAAAAPSPGSRWRSPARRAPCHTWASRCGSCPSRAARACTAAAMRCWSRRAIRARRSSAGTGAARRRRSAPRLDAATQRAGSRYTGLTIRGQRTRWASCSSTGAMSFNWRLLLAPPEILDYVVEHEVCHLEVMDHSPRFWRLLASRSPDWRAHSAWLRRYGLDAQPLSAAPRTGRRRRAPCGTPGPSTRSRPPSPRTSSPAAAARSLELDPDRDQVRRPRSGGRSPRRHRGGASRGRSAWRSRSPRPAISARSCVDLRPAPDRDPVAHCTSASSASTRFQRSTSQPSLRENVASTARRGSCP